MKNNQVYTYNMYIFLFKSKNMSTRTEDGNIKNSLEKLAMNGTKKWGWQPVGEMKSRFVFADFFSFLFCLVGGFLHNKEKQEDRNWSCRREIKELVGVMSSCGWERMEASTQKVSLGKSMENLSVVIRGKGVCEQFLT